MTSGEQPQLLSQTFIVELVIRAEDAKAIKVLHVASSLDAAAEFIKKDEEENSSFFDFLAFNRMKNGYRVTRFILDSTIAPEMVFYKETYRT